MKITKRQLRRIIKEEKRALLKEARMANPRGCFSPMQSRAQPEFAAMIKEVNPAGDLRDRMQGMQGHSKNTNDWVEMLGQLINQDLTERGLWYEDEGTAIRSALEILRREIKDEMRGPTR